MARTKTSQRSDLVAQALENIVFVPERDLAEAFGFKRVCWQFKEFLAYHGIEPVPGRPGYYDPKVVRKRLDEAQPELNKSEAPISLTEERRKRRGKV